MNPKSQKRTPYLDADGIVRYSLEKPELRDPVYTAMGAFITAYAREKTIRSGQAVYDRFIYADTDSLHLIGHEIPEGLDVHPTKLGAWKNEGIFTDSRFVRAKTYIETIHEVKPDTMKNFARALATCSKISREPDGVHIETLTVTCAGMPDNVKELVTYDNFVPGSVFPGKLVPRRYPGGVVLEEINFTIKY